MRLKPVFLTMIVITVASLGFPVAAHAQSKIAVVDIQEIMSESKAAKSIQEQLETQRKAFQDDVSKRERALLDQQKALMEEQGQLMEEQKTLAGANTDGSESFNKKLAAFEKKRDEFEAELLEMRKLVQKRRQALEKAAGDAIGKLRMEVVEIVAEIADANDYDMVVTKQNVILAQKDMEITSQVMTRLDKNIKEIELKVETQ